MNELPRTRRPIWNMVVYALLGLSCLALSKGTLAASVTYSYDEAGRLVTTTYDDGSVTSYTLDAAGNRKNVGTGALPGLPAISVPGISTTGSYNITWTAASGTVTRYELDEATSSNFSGATPAYSGPGLSKSITGKANGTYFYRVRACNDVGCTASVAGAAGINVTLSGGGAVQLSASTYSGGEASGQQTITITATRVGGSVGAASVPYTITAGTATAGSDYTATNSSFSWADGDAANKTFTITVVDDALVESNETLSVALGTPSGAAAGTPNSATVTIVSDDNGPTGVVQLTSNSYSGGEASGQRTITITATRTGGSFGAASVPYTITAGTATAGVDYTATNASFSWADGDAANKTFTITVLDDALVESNETLTVALGTPSGVTLGTPTSATVTIASDDNPPAGIVQLSASAYSGGEASGQRTITITATRTGGSFGTASVPYTITAGTATAGSDYTATNASFSWADADAANKTFTITVLDDALVESNETLTVALGTPSGVTLGTPTSATVTITSDDNPPAGTLQFSPASYPTGEWQGPIQIFVTRINGSFGAVSVPYSLVAGTATVGSDYVDTSGTLTWADGDTATKSFTVTPIDDTAVEGTETFTAVLGTPSGATLGSPSTATVSLGSDDPVSTLSFASGTWAGGEASGQRAISITVLRGNGANGAASVQYITAGGTAIEGTDYQAASGTLSWPTGDNTPRSFIVNVLDDTAIESTESFQVQLFSVSGATLVSPSTATVNITSDDNPPAGVVQLTSSSYSGGEASGQQTITITATRTGGSFGAASVPYTITAGTATAGSDYTATNGSFSWADGDAANKTFTITVVDDALVESNETLSVALGTPSGVTLGTPNSATVTITSDDNPPAGSVQLSANAYSGGETSTQRTITITATRTGGSFGAASVPYTITAGTATAGSDYTATNGSFSWADGDAANKTFTITVVDDALVESNETLSVALGTPSGVTLGTPNSATVTITSDDNPPSGTVQLSASTYSGGEASSLRTITVIAQRIGGSFGAASVSYSVGGGTATGGSDYTVSPAASGTLNWSDGDAADKTITITVLDDTAIEGTETINATLSGVSGASSGSPLSATVNVNDDDSLPAITFTGTYTFIRNIGSGAVGSFQIITAGDIYANTATSNTLVDSGDWMSPKVASAASQFEITVVSNACTGTGSFGPATNAVVLASTNPQWGRPMTSGASTCGVHLQFRDVPTHTLLGEGTVILQAH